MKKSYRRPWLKVVELNENDMVCTSGTSTSKMYIEMKDYDTYEENPNQSRSIWTNNDGTGSDF